MICFAAARSHDCSLRRGSTFRWQRIVGFCTETFWWSTAGRSYNEHSLSQQCLTGLCHCFVLGVILSIGFRAEWFLGVCGTRLGEFEPTIGCPYDESPMEACIAFIEAQLFSTWPSNWCLHIQFCQYRDAGATSWNRRRSENDRRRRYCDGGTRVSRVLDADFYWKCLRCEWPFCFLIFFIFLCLLHDIHTPVRVSVFGCLY